MGKHQGEFKWFCVLRGLTDERVRPGTYHVLMLDLQDCYLKLERARRHIADLENAQANYVGTEPYKGIAEYDPHVNMTFFALRELPEIPRGISLYVGDAAHNLRTALDYLACEFRA